MTTREDEIREALKSVMSGMKQPKLLGVPSSVSQSRVGSRVTKPRIDSYTNEEDSSFRTYIRSNTISNIAEVREDFEQGGEEQHEFTRIDVTAHEVPSKRQVKRMSGSKMLPSSRVFGASAGTGVGSSRSVMLDAIKAIAHPETGCIVVEKSYYNRLPEHMKATTLPNSGTTGMTR